MSLVQQTKVVRALMALALFVAAAPYVTMQIYRFPPRRPFSGPAILNPYGASHGPWQQANLHAHAQGWTRSASDGRQPVADVLEWYRARGYAIAAVANHQQLAPQPWPIYEHGYNLGKRHVLVLGAATVTWFDIPFWQSVSAKQYVLNRLHESAALVALAHPSERRAYSATDVATLTGYELLEVVNDKSVATALWDAALSSGRLVWGIGSDDTHDVTNDRHTGSAWTMLDSVPTSFPSTLDALREGRAYAVEGQGGRTDVVLQQLAVHGQTVRVTLSGALATVSFTGQDGRLLKKTNGVLSAEYTLTPADTYVRTTVRSDGSVLYLNPVVRYDGTGVPTAQATINLPATWLWRFTIAVGCIGVWFLVTGRRTHAIGRV